MRKNYTKSPLTQGKKARARALGENGKIARVLCSPFLCHIPNKGTIKGDNKKHDLATFYYEILQNNKKRKFNESGSFSSPLKGLDLATPRRMSTRHSIASAKDS